MIPETSRSHYNSNNPLEAQEKLQRLLRTLRLGGTQITPARKIKHQQLFIEVNTRELIVTVRTKTETLARFHRNPTLAEAVQMGRSHCQKYYPRMPVLEFVIR